MRGFKVLLSLALVVAVIAVLPGCIEEKFIPDPSDPRLPKYTENGNQVGGALINDVAWKTDFSTNFGLQGNRSFYFTNHGAGDSVTLTLDGIVTEGTNKDAPISFIVVLKNRSLEKLEDIASMDGETFLLDGEVNQVILDDRYETIRHGVDYHYGGSGRITFRNIRTVRNTTITRQNGDKYNPLIVAGTFEFSFSEISTTVKLGRFDFYINDYYLYQR